MKALTKKYKPVAARQKCKTDGAHLPVPKSEAENQWFNNYRKQVKIGDFWLGIDDAEVEGKWKTEDGDRLTYGNWDYNQPSNTRNSVRGRAKVNFHFTFCSNKNDLRTTTKIMVFFELRMPNGMIPLPIGTCLYCALSLLRELPPRMNFIQSNVGSVTSSRRQHLQ